MNCSSDSYYFLFMNKFEIRLLNEADGNVYFT